jgi:hypothetical protein
VLVPQQVAGLAVPLGRMHHYVHEHVRKKRVSDGKSERDLRITQSVHLVLGPAIMVALVFAIKDFEIIKVVEIVTGALSAISGLAIKLQLGAKQSSLPNLDTTLQVLDHALQTDWNEYDRLVNVLLSEILRGALK